MSKLFVGGLSWGISNDRLREAFSEFGDVREAKVIFDHETGRSKGFGFVTFVKPADAQNALRAMDGVELEGRAVRVNVAEDKNRKGPSRREDRPEPEVHRRVARTG